MQSLKLNAKKRASGKSGKSELNENDTMGVVYGREVESTPIAVNFQELKKLFSQSGYNHVIELVIDEKESHNVLFKDIQIDPISNNISHFDFYAVKKGEKIQASVPVVVVGESPAVVKGAQLTTFLEEVDVECVPSKLPENFEIDVTALEEIGDGMSVSDLKSPDGVEIKTDLEQPLVRVDEIKEMQVEEETSEESAEEGEAAEGEESSESAGGEEGGESDAGSEEAA
jgi:large subunit ribosomal protein L25